MIAARAKKTSARGEARPDEELTLVVGVEEALVLVPVEAFIQIRKC